MMATTHAALALFAAAPLALLFPEQAPHLALAAIAGGIFPDIDVLVGTHRKTLHFPILYWLAVALAAIAISNSPVMLIVFTFLFAAALHSVTDIFGGGLEREPWKQTTSQAVYCHALQRWFAPRHYITYDGSPGDLLLTATLTPVIFLYTDSLAFKFIAATGLVIAVGYTTIRKSLPALEDWLHEHVPLLHPILNSLHGNDT